MKKKEFIDYLIKEGCSKELRYLERHGFKLKKSKLFSLQNSDAYEYQKVIEFGEYLKLYVVVYVFGKDNVQCDVYLRKSFSRSKIYLEFLLDNIYIHSKKESTRRVIEISITRAIESLKMISDELSKINKDLYK